MSEDAKVQLVNALCVLGDEIARMHAPVAERVVVIRRGREVCRALGAYLSALSDKMEKAPPVPPIVEEARPERVSVIERLRGMARTGIVSSHDAQWVERACQMLDHG